MSVGPDSLGHPLEFPPEFKQWLTEYVAQNVPKLPISQVFGFQLQRVRTDTVDTSQARSSTAYGDLTTVGPTLSDLANGWYLLIFGGNITGVNQGRISVSLNGVAAADDDGVLGGVTHASGMRILLTHLTANNRNEIVLKYRSTDGSSQSFAFRYIHAIKVLTLDE